MLLLVAVLVAEILLTLWDFVVEISVRKQLGDVYAGLIVMAAGVFLSGVRDLYAALALPYGSWPWKSEVVAATRK